MIKKILILVTINIMIYIFGCGPCPNHPTYSFNWTGINIENRSVTFNGDAITNEPTTDSIVKNYGFSIIFSHEIYSSLSVFNFKGQLYALTCINEEYVIQNKVKSIDVFTLRDFDSTHLKNSNISEYFFSYKSTNLKHVPTEILDLNSAIDNDPILSTDSDPELGILREDSSILAILKKEFRPSNDNYIQFEIIVTMEDNSTLEATSEIIELQ